MKTLLFLPLILSLSACGSLGLDSVSSSDFRASQTRQNVNIDYHECTKESMRYIVKEPGVTYLTNPYKGFIINCMRARGYYYTR